jgi:hypothetical protein
MPLEPRSSVAIPVGSYPTPIRGENAAAQGAVQSLNNEIKEIDR